MTDAQKPMTFEECVKAAAKIVIAKFQEKALEYGYDISMVMGEEWCSLIIVQDLRPLFDELTELIKTLRHELEERVVLNRTTIAERDKTIGELKQLIIEYREARQPWGPGEDSFEKCPQCQKCFMRKGSKRCESCVNADIDAALSDHPERKEG